MMSTTVPLFTANSFKAIVKHALMMSYFCVICYLVFVGFLQLFCITFLQCPSKVSQIRQLKCCKFTSFLNVLFTTQSNTLSIRYLKTNRRYLLNHCKDLLDKLTNPSYREKQQAMRKQNNICYLVRLSNKFYEIINIGYKLPICHKQLVYIYSYIY